MYVCVCIYANIYTYTCVFIQVPYMSKQCASVLIGSSVASHTGVSFCFTPPKKAADCIMPKLCQNRWFSLSRTEQTPEEIKRDPSPRCRSVGKDQMRQMRLRAHVKASPWSSKHGSYRPRRPKPPFTPRLADWSPNPRSQWVKMLSSVQLQYEVCLRVLLESFMLPTSSQRLCGSCLTLWSLSANSAIWRHRAKAMRYAGSVVVIRTVWRLAPRC